MTLDAEEKSGRLSRRTLLSAVAGTGLMGAAGCLGDADDNPGDDVSGNPDIDEFVFAAAVRDDPEDVTRDWEPLADAVEARTGVPTRIDEVTNDSAAVAALGAGQAHTAYLSGGPSWVGWQEFGLEVLAVEVDEAGDTHYTAGAWVRADSTIESVEDLRGVDSCHTGDLTGAGMLIPTAHLAQEGHVTFEEGDDVTAIRDAVDEFFGNPVIGGGYVGALQCLSTGQGEVAFARTTTPEDYCGGPEAENWCLDMDEYRLLIAFTDVPSHTFMGSPERSAAELELLGDALLDISDDPDDREILDDLLGHQLTASTAEEHLGPYGALLANLPGIEDHLLD